MLKSPSSDIISSSMGEFPTYCGAKTRPWPDLYSTTSLRNNPAAVMGIRGTISGSYKKFYGRVYASIFNNIGIGYTAAMKEHKAECTISSIVFAPRVSD